MDDLKNKKGFLAELKLSRDEITEFSKKFQGYEKDLNNYLITSHEEFL